MGVYGGENPPEMGVFAHLRWGTFKNRGFWVKKGGFGAPQGGVLGPPPGGAPGGAPGGVPDSSRVFRALTG